MVKLGSPNLVLILFCYVAFACGSSSGQTSDSFDYEDKSSNTLMTYTGHPRNAAAFDYNLDGAKDLMIGTGATAWKQISMTSLKVPRFLDETTSVFQHSLPSDSQGFIIADYDNDSYIDVYVPSLTGHRLYRNVSGVFSDVTNSVGSDFTDNDESFGAAWGDYDADGYLDLLLLLGGDFGRWDEGSDTQVLLRYNSTTGEFEDQTSASGFQDQPRINSALWADFNGDNDVDLVLIQGCDDLLTCTGNNSTYFVNVDGTELVDYSSILFPDKALLKGNFTLGTVADVNNDARLDLVYVMDDQIGYLVPEDWTDGIPNWNDGEVKLVDGWKKAKWTPIGTAPLDICNLDYDLDGRIDVLGAAYQTPVLYENYDDSPDLYAYPTAIAAITDFGGPADQMPNNGFVAADFVGDGLTELYFARTDDKDFFYKAIDSNPATLPVWIGIRLESEAGTNNYYGIGATVTVKAGTHIQSQVVDGGSGRGYQNDLDLVFGLGDYTGQTVDVTVRWPAGGVNEVEDLAIRQYHTIQDYPTVIASTVSARTIYRLGGSVHDWEFIWETGPNWDPDEDYVRFDISGLSYGCTPSETVLNRSMSDVDLVVEETSSGSWKHTLTWVDTDCRAKCDIPFTVESGFGTYSSVSSTHYLKIRTCLQAP